MAWAVLFAVLLAPEVFTPRRFAGLKTQGTRGLDFHHRRWCFWRPNHKNRSVGEAHDGFGDRTNQEPSEPLAPVGSYHDEIGLHVAC
jgi:hypothetical protein